MAFRYYHRNTQIKWAILLTLENITKCLNILKMKYQKLKRYSYGNYHKKFPISKMQNINRKKLMLNLMVQKNKKWWGLINVFQYIKNPNKWLQLAVDNIASFSQHVTGSKTRTSKKLINMAEAQLKTPKTRQWAQQWNPTITDMVSLKLYTDSNTASGKFRSSFREGVISTNKQLQIDTIVWQQAMAHAFGMYTKNIDKSKVNVPPILYHGTTIACIDTFEQLLKPQSVFFAGPLSTTTIRQIAYNFALPEQGGMLLKLEFDPSSPYLPMNAVYFSEYDEKEWLVFDAKMIVKDICFSNGCVSNLIPIGATEEISKKQQMMQQIDECIRNPAGSQLCIDLNKKYRYGGNSLCKLAWQNKHGRPKGATAIQYFNNEYRINGVYYKDADNTYDATVQSHQFGLFDNGNYGYESGRKRGFIGEPMEYSKYREYNRNTWIQYFLLCVDVIMIIGICCLTTIVLFIVGYLCTEFGYHQQHDSEYNKFFSEATIL
eukprot:28201_1